MVLLLHIISIFFETGLGIRIFSEAFPKREDWQWQHILSEVFMDLLIWHVILTFFLRIKSFENKALFMLLWTSGLLLYHYGIEKKNKMKKEHTVAINNCLKYAEFVAIAGILAWNYWMSYISVIMVFLGNMLLPFFYHRYYKGSLLQAYIWEVLYIATIQIIKCAYMVCISGIENQGLIYANLSGRLPYI